MTQQSLTFDIDDSALYVMQELLGATPQEMAGAVNRATQRTQKTMLSRSAKAVQQGMGAKNQRKIKQRLKAFRYAFRLAQTSGDATALKLWYGLNDVSVGHLKGKVSRLGSKLNPQGARFSSQTLGNHEDTQAFVGRLYNRRSMFFRKGRSRFPVAEAKIAISDKLHVMLEDEILSELPDVFIKHYTTDLSGRIAARAEISQRQAKWK